MSPPIVPPSRAVGASIGYWQRNVPIVAVPASLPMPPGKPPPVKPPPTETQVMPLGQDVSELPVHSRRQVPVGAGAAASAPIIPPPGNAPPPGKPPPVVVRALQV